jgi:hypothetical protein
MELKLPRGLSSLLDLMDPGDALVVRCIEFRCACTDITKCRHKPGKKIIVLDDLAYDGLVRRAINRSLDRADARKRPSPRRRRRR